MAKKKFNVQQWLEPPEQSDKIKPIRENTRSTSREMSASSSKGFTKAAGQMGNKYSDVIQLISQIETTHTDIAASYDEWRNIGFALSDEFGENGRDLYHRISQFHPNYTPTECDKQFDNCMISKGAGVNINTLFYLAKNADIELPKNRPYIRNTKELPKEVEQTEVKKLPTLPNSLFPQLPDFLKKITEVAETDEERDLLLLGSIVTISSTLPSVFGIYHRNKVFANLFLFISAQASAGKGRLNHCRKLVKPIHDNLKDQGQAARQQYEIDLAEYNANKKKQPDLEKPLEPPIQLLFIPANSSASGAFQLLNDNNGRGLLFETEGDTLANTFKSDFGNYSDGFRKSFHHETISYYRKTNRELVDIESPCLSALLSGTPMQVSNLIPSSEDGLFSRFMFYYMNMQPVWADVFESNTATGLDDYFYKLGKEYYIFYQALKSSPDMQFTLTKDQQQLFHQFFQTCFQHYFNLKGEEYTGTIRRLGLITFRISMILSVLRLMETGEIPDNLACEQQDYNTSIAIAETLIEHAAHIFNQLPATEKPITRPNKRERFYDVLPLQFNRNGYLEVAKQLGVNPKTAEGYITRFKKGGLLHSDVKDSYTK